MRNIVFEFSRITEQGALAAYKLIGRHDKNKADDAAVKAMRYMMNILDFDGEIVIGEGEMDEAPMLYIGEKVGKGGMRLDIAVDPIDGTKLVSEGKNNGVCVLAAAEKGLILKAPDMYMEKLAVSEGAKDAINLDLPLKDNLINIAKALGKDFSDLTVAILDRERHHKAIELMKSLNIKVYTSGEGDIVMGLLACMPFSDIDVLYGIGGAPEGVLLATAIRALGGNMEGRLVPYNQVYPKDDNCFELAEIEAKRCAEIGVEIGKKLIIDDLIRGDDFIFSLTGITNGELLQGVRRNGTMATTETLLIRGKSQTIRIIKSTHLLNKKDDYLLDLLL
ncbi:class II fructose-bisphosphatase [Mycoplasmatota bacterium]|nr:class II fructose-bisphosphatase [Mycoplasmatota bacterium]